MKRRAKLSVTAPIRSRTLDGGLPLSQREEFPRMRDALEMVFAARDEVECGAGDKVADGAGHEDLAGVCMRGDTSRYVHGEAGDIVTAPLQLTRVDADANGQG